VNDLKELMRQNVAAPPPDHLDVDALMSEGLRRVRRRQRRLIAIPAALVLGVLVTGQVVSSSNDSAKEIAGQPPRPDAPTITLADATPAEEGRDYEVLTSYTNENLDADNGQYLDGVTDDGLILFRDGPRMNQRFPRYALMDPETGDKDWLPKLAIGQSQAWPVELGADRLVLASGDYSENSDGMESKLVAHIFERSSRTWREQTWHGLPAVDFPGGAVAHDGRLYVKVPATQGAIPEGGWPMGPDGEAEDADAEGDTFALWSVSLTDATDVRDEQLVLGDLAFTDSLMVWTDSSNGDAGRVHVRDLATGEEHSFDPNSGERCNLLGFGATDDRVVMSQYCGTYEDGVRDDRIQVVTTDGEQAFTLQGNSIEGLTNGDDVVTVTSYDRDAAGTYLYDLATDRFVRLSDDVSQWAFGGLAGDDVFMWDTPEGRHGATQWVGRLLGG